MGHRIECSVHAVLSKLLNVDMDKIKILTKIIRLLIIATENGTAIDKLRKDIQIAEKNPGIYLKYFFIIHNNTITISKYILIYRQ